MRRWRKRNHKFWAIVRAKSRKKYGKARKKHFYKSRWRKNDGLPLYVRHKRTGMKFTLFGIKQKDALLKDLHQKGFERISFKEYYRKS